MLDNLDKLRGVTRERTKYETIKKFLLDEFMRGSYKVGELIPSENTLAKTAGVARSTVRQAIGELEKEGLVQRTQGKGSYFVGNLRQQGTQQLQAFSLIVPDIARGLYPTLVKGFDHQAGLAHHQVMVCNTAFDISRQGNIILQMIDKKVAGVVLVPALSSPTPAFHVHQLQAHDVPVVFCHRPVEGTVAPLVTWDRERVARVAGEAFLEHGHRRVAYFAGYRYLQTEAYEHGLRETLREQGLELAESNVFYGDSLDDTPEERQKRSEALRTVLEGPNPVTAIFCHDDDEAELIHHLSMELGYRVPRDFSLIGFGDCHDRSGVFRKGLTSVSVNEFNLGARAARVLQEVRDGERSVDSDEIVFKLITLVKGSTLDAAPKGRGKGGA